jgi:hypothetical protein
MSSEAVSAAVYPTSFGAVKNWSAIHFQCSDHSKFLLTLPGAAYESIKWFSELLEARTSRHGCESNVKFRIDISSFQVFE